MGSGLHTPTKFFWVYPPPGDIGQDRPKTQEKNKAKIQPSQFQAPRQWSGDERGLVPNDREPGTGILTKQA